jgi:hypothetical protein
MPPSPDAVPDDLILAAVARSERHRSRKTITRPNIHAQLSIPSRSGEVRHIKARITVLTDEGCLKQSRRRGVDFWTLTPKGRRRLKRANVESLLPESPQHREWRNATTLAAQEIEGMRENLRATLAEARGQIDADASSDVWFELSARLQRTSWLVGSATYCLREWVEPNDERADTDERSDPSDAGLSRKQKARRVFRRAGRRNFRLWGDEDS